MPLSVPVYQILLSLVSQDLHGYAIIQDVRTRTDGEVTLTASTLYAAVRRLVNGGIIEEINRKPAQESDSRRRYYRITRFGKKVARAEAERLERQVAMARDKSLLPSTQPRS